MNQIPMSMVFRAAGRADTANKVPATPKTVYAVGSISKLLRLAIEAKTGMKPSKAKKPEKADVAITQEDLRAYAGWYATIAGPVKVTAGPGGLETKLMHKRMRLVPLADGGLGLRYKFLGLFPVSLGDLEHLSLSRDIVAGHEIIKFRSVGPGSFWQEKR